MRGKLTFVLAVLCSLLCNAAVQAQADAHSKVLLESVLKAFGGDEISDLTLTATALRNPNVNTETLNATMRATAAGANQISYESAAGTLTETRVVDAHGIPTGNWSDPKGTRHVFAGHNMLTEPNWFFPELAVGHALKGSGGLAVSYLGRETFEGTEVEHLRFVASSSNSLQMQAWTQTELYLDAGTLLPFAMSYNDHPDDNVLVNIPVIVLYTNYARLSGVLLPTHVQQLRNNSLCIDLNIQAIQVNTRISIALPQ
jgi:hypothetical protein